MIGGQPACAGVPDADRRRRGPAGEPPPLHRVHDPGAGQRVDHVRSVAGDQDAVAVGLLDGRVDDDATHCGSDGRAPGVASRDPGVEVLARVPPVGPEGHDPEPHVRDPHALGEQPSVAPGSDAITELEVHRVGIELDVLHHVLRAGFHVAGRHARVQACPPAHHRLDPVRPDHEPGAQRLLVPPRSPDAHVPATVGVALHPRCLRRHADLDAGGRRPRGEEGVEAGAVEDPRHGPPLGDGHLGVVRRDEDDARDAARHPGRAVGIDELAQPGVPHAFGAPHGEADHAIALE